MKNSSEIEDWENFIKILAFDNGLSRIQGKILLARFPTPIEDEFCKITHEAVAQHPILAKTERPSNSLGDHLRKIYALLGYGSKNVDDNYRKAKLVFTQLKQKFDIEQEQKRIVVNLQKDKIEQLNEFLLHLNYFEEENKFHKAVEDLDRSGVFLVEIKGNHTQRWLANRLMVNNQILKGAYSRGIEANPNWRTNIDLFWQWLAKVDTYDRSQQETILQKLAGLMQTQGQQNRVLIAIYNIDALRRDDINSIIQEFWLPFQAIVQQESYWDTRECLLLLMGNPGWTTKMDEKQSSSNLFQIHLPVWGPMTEKHICGWLKSEGVFTFCEQHSEKSKQDIFEFLDIQPDNPSVNQYIGEPETVLQNICTLLNLPNGIAELEQYWKIMS